MRRLLSMCHKHNLYLFLIFVIFVLGIFLRLYHLSDSFEWHYDIARDFLSGLLIAYHKQLPQVGHWNSGFSIHYPPYYFYYLALISLISKSAVQIIYILAFIQSISILFIYYIAKNIFNSRLAGLLAASLLSISDESIFMTHYPLSAHNSFPFFIFSFWIFIEGIYKRKVLYIYLSLIIFTFSTTIFSGYIALIPVILYLISNISIIVAIQSAAIIAISYLIYQIPLIITGGLTSIIPVYGAISGNYRLYFYKVISYFQNEVIQMFHQYTLFIGIALFILFFCLNKSQKKIVYILLTSVLCVFISAILKTGTFLGHYFFFLQPIFILLVMS